MHAATIKVKLVLWEHPYCTRTSSNIFINEINFFKLLILTLFFFASVRFRLLRLSRR